MQPREFFHHCPRCGARQDAPPSVNHFICARCGFRLFFNPAVATAAVIEDEAGRILCLQRARDPQRGKLAFPGGFIDIGESAESALRREIREEVGLEVGELKFLCSSPNDYLYDGIRYPVVDFLFSARVSDLNGFTLEPSEASSAEWMAPIEVNPLDLAFPSLREALRIFLALRAA